MADLKEMLDAQWKLQVDSFGKDPCTLEPAERAEFIRWNVLALIVELTEALDEVSWKPWASAEFLNSEALHGEMVDAFHFFMNILLATGNGRSPYKIAIDFRNEYMRKREVNATRQRDGYTGLEKCPGCKRALEDCTGTADNGDTYCTGCGKVLSRT